MNHLPQSSHGSTLTCRTDPPGELAILPREFAILLREFAAPHAGCGDWARERVAGRRIGKLGVQDGELAG